MSICICPNCSEENNSVHDRKRTDGVLINTPSTLNTRIENFNLIICKKCKNEFHCNKIKAFGFLKLWQAFAILIALFIIMFLTVSL